MSFHSWLQNLRSAISSGRVHRQPRRRGSHRAATHRPTVEVLEDRCLLAYAVTNLGTLGGYNTHATDLNEAGQVVGYSDVSDRTHAFLWDNGTMIDLGTLGGNHSGAHGINDQGQVVGDASLPDGSAHAFLITPQGGEWFRDNDQDGRNDLMADLGTLNGSAYSQAFDINNAGQVVGKSGYNLANAFFWDPASGMIDLGEGNPTAINEVGQVTGYVTQFTFPFLWDAVNGMTFLDAGPGYFGGAGEGINDAGEITGYLWAENGHQVAFLWSGGYVQLGDAGIPMGWEPAVFSSGADVNNSGQVVGTIVYDVGDGEEGPHAFLWDATGGMVFLYSQLLPGSNAFPLSAQAINDSGAIVASSSYSSYLLTPIPEGTPAIRIDDAPPVTEGHIGTRTATFTVTLSGASTEPVSVAYATASGTATAGSDYQATTGTLTFAPGETSKTITVQVNGDRLAEANETVVVNLSNPTNATIADGQGTGTILDDEPRIRISDVSGSEGNAAQTPFAFTVSLSSAYDAPVTVDWTTADGTATAGSDYQAVSGTLTFAPGETSKTVTILVNGDRLGEPNETFVVNVSNPTNATIADGLGVGTILDDEPRISISDVTKKEGKKGQKTLFTFTVTVSTAYDQPVTMSFTTANGTAKTSDGDYIAKTGTLTFASGETTKTITIEVKGDSKKETNETFYLDLFALSGNALFAKNHGIGTILNDD